MFRVLFALAALAAAPIASVSAAALPSHFGQSLSRQISSDGPRTVAWNLTLSHDWAQVEQDIANNDPTLSPAMLRALLDYTPRFETVAMQHALRARLQKDALAGLAVLSPVAHSPYSGQAICGAGEARWKHQVAHLIADTHDITFALQREACVNALRLHSRR
ncbi:hypothetical protein [Asaia krungthepensis]|uniref:Secreted protein n=1 Tax=Asaia krungthepensis NRIC 0535 TaxID=1307925 RepID=A0ABQ0PWA7_9PROT|nr:hypothetical protein [Asaia krungthepensis]GBQ83186.1 hypothetical protein AA0535_0182 [Asaia krungthepensis NRIC 0535]